MKRASVLGIDKGDPYLLPRCPDQILNVWYDRVKLQVSRGRIRNSVASQIYLSVRADPSVKDLGVVVGRSFQAVPIHQLPQLLDTLVDGWFVLLGVK